jgi:hypothetical protein
VTGSANVTETSNVTETANVREREKKEKIREDITQKRQSHAEPPNRRATGGEKNAFFFFSGIDSTTKDKDAGSKEKDKSDQILHSAKEPTECRRPKSQVQKQAGRSTTPKADQRV